MFPCCQLSPLEGAGPSLPGFPSAPCRRGHPCLPLSRAWRRIYTHLLTASSAGQRIHRKLCKTFPLPLFFFQRGQVERCRVEDHDKPISSLSLKRKVVSCSHYQHWPTKPGAEASLKKYASRFIFSRVFSLKNRNNLYRDLVQLLVLISPIYIWKVLRNYRILYCLTMCLRDSSECDPIRDYVEVKIFVKYVGIFIFLRRISAGKVQRGNIFLKENYSGRSQIYQPY